MILVCGGLADSVTELVCSRLEALGHPYRLLNLGTYPAEFQVKWQWKGSYPEGYISGPDWRVDLDELTGVYVRYLGAEGRMPVKGIDSDLSNSVYAECDSALIALLEYLPCIVVNRSAGAMSNHSKPYQALLLRECGLLVPPTLVTSDPDEARRFYDESNGDVIFKSLSGIRSIVRRVREDDLVRLSLLEHGPAQFQKFIPGENVRVHTVGDEAFATLVHSEAVDYRYARREGQTVEMEPMTLPYDVLEGCRRIARRLDLLFAGIDFKLTPDGDFYCFEVNPSPGFIFYEQHSGQPISAALADLLLKGQPAVRAEDESCAA
ncbi:MAG TPA: glutathione synthase [Blastocatellia bacterium]|nr:glutathione synthase [Blastocatellia bacterium]